MGTRALLKKIVFFNNTDISNIQLFKRKNIQYELNHFRNHNYELLNTMLKLDKLLLFYQKLLNEDCVLSVQFFNVYHDRSESGMTTQ